MRMQRPSRSILTNEWKSGPVLRLNTAFVVHSTTADWIRVTNTPTFILFDPAGKEQRHRLREAPSFAEFQWLISDA